MDIIPYIFIAVAGFGSGVLSGMSGGGGGMLMIPAFIAVGLPPQNAVATGKMNGLGAAFGGLSAFIKTGYIRKDILKVMVPIAIVIGVTTPFIFFAIESDLFQIILGAILLLMTPTLFIKNKLSSIAAKKHRVAGYGAYSGVLTLQSLFGSGVGSLALFVLTLLFGTTKLEANATKRAITAVLTPITFIALLLGGFVVLSYGSVGMLSVFAGTHLGSKIAIKKGERFVTFAMAIVIAISGCLLIINAMR
jgi:hypothetical protein